MEKKNIPVYEEGSGTGEHHRHITAMTAPTALRIQEIGRKQWRRIPTIASLDSRR